MSDREVCRDCGRPVATEQDYDAIPEGEGEHLCWGGHQCSRYLRSQEFRARHGDADAMEDEIARLREEYRVLKLLLHETEDDRDDLKAACDRYLSGNARLEKERDEAKERVTILETTNRNLHDVIRERDSRVRELEAALRVAHTYVIAYAAFSDRGEKNEKAQTDDAMIEDILSPPEEEKEFCDKCILVGDRVVLCDDCSPPEEPAPDTLGEPSPPLTCPECGWEFGAKEPPAPDTIPALMGKLTDALGDACYAAGKLGVRVEKAPPEEGPTSAQLKCAQGEHDWGEDYSPPEEPPVETFPPIPGAGEGVRLPPAREEEEDYEDEVLP